MEIKDLKIGSVVELKKPHPSGEKQWELIRIGAKYKFRAVHQFDLFIEISRHNLKYNLKKIY